MSKKETSMVDEQELQELGFSKKYIADARQRAARGVPSFVPPDDLVQRTIARCAAQFPEPKQIENPSPGFLLKAIEAVATLAPSVVGTLPVAIEVYRHCVRRGQLAKEMAEALAYSLSEPASQPSLFLVDDHVSSAISGEEERSFRSERQSTCQDLDEFLIPRGLPRSGRIDILRPSVADYSDEDITTLRQEFLDSTSDLWLLPHDRSGPLTDQHLIIIGNRKVLARTGSSEEQLRYEGPDEVTDTLSALQEARGHAIVIKSGGEFVPAVRDAMMADQSFHAFLQETGVAASKPVLATHV